MTTTKKTTTKAEPAAVKVGLWEALAAAQAKCGHIAKDSRNPHHGYDYTSAEDMIGMCRSALLENDLVLTRHWTIGPSGEGGSFDVLNTFHLAHAPSKDSVTHKVNWPAIPGKGRPEDKALAAALTSSLGYYLRDLLLVARGGDEMERRDDSAYQPTRQVFRPSKAAGAGSVAPPTGNTPTCPEMPLEAIPQMERFQHILGNRLPRVLNGTADDIWAMLWKMAQNQGVQFSREWVETEILREQRLQATKAEKAEQPPLIEEVPQ